MNDFFKARNNLKVGKKEYVYLPTRRIGKSASHGPQAASVFDPYHARGRAPSMQ